MKPASKRVSLKMEVPFHEVDALRVVWHGHYYKYFEIARTKLFRELGVIDGGLTPNGYTWVVVESKCRYSHPLRFGDHFQVDAWISDIEYRVNVSYEITNLSQNNRSARGHSHLATLDANNKLLLNTPEPLLQYLAHEDELRDVKE